MLPIYQQYIKALKKIAFTGEVCTDYASRLSVATDNSIYQIIPQAVVFPKCTADVCVLFKLAHQENFRTITFSPRGGGIATNGQSLSPGIIIDCSKYLCDILEINLEEKWVRVQPGVIQDQLNAYLKPLGMYFPPEISPSNRATLGGMINTDACGNGSKILGRTSDYVKDLTCVLPNAEIWHTENKTIDEITHLLEQHATLILEKFTDTPRTLAGYNLKKMLLNKGNLNYLISGSEGTLAVVTECKLRIEPIPSYKKLVVLKYKTFKDALNSHHYLDPVKPLVIETIDEKLIELARTDLSYFKIKNFIEVAYETTGAINLVEFVGQNENLIEADIQKLCESLDKTVLGFYITKSDEEIKLLWDLRKKSVGLISKKIIGTRRPIPFIEDTAVPPEKLADYIQEFRALLDAHHLTYGMYGHIDAGCIHVRPALDMKLVEDERLMQKLSDEVVALVKKYGGVLWGEHGQGFRCEYGKEFFGDELYAIVRRIKTWIDPYNQLNPGKIAVANNTSGSLVKLTDHLRGHFDKQIPMAQQQAYSSAVACNGNGACFNYSTQEVMCPSYKVTKNRIHSPKGRATLIREWLREKFDKSFPSEIYEAMNGCLGCKACTSQCPLSVDIPDLKSKFLEKYHQQHTRPLRDYFIAALEPLAKLQAHFPKISNTITQYKFFTKRLLKLVDLPPVHAFPKVDSVPLAEANLVLLQDAFTSFYQPEVFLSVYQLMKCLGYKVYVPDFFANGKPLHAKGFLKRFTRLAQKNIKFLEKFNLPVIGIDPSITLTYRDEYKKINSSFDKKIFLLQEWLQQVELPEKITKGKEFYLLSHCTEKSAVPETEKYWQMIFSRFGLNLKILSAGCCGMAGSYGHEIEHYENSRKLFVMDWEEHIHQHADVVLATGYSCRSQVARFAGVKVKHPAEVLWEILGLERS